MFYFTDLAAVVYESSKDSKLTINLKHQLKLGRDRIRKHYTSFKSTVCSLIIKKGIPIDELLFFLRDYPGLEKCKERFDSLPKDVKYYDIFKLIGDEFASYLHYDIFQDLLDKYCTASEKDCDELKYSEHLKAYIEQLDIKHFLKINPDLQKLPCGSKELCLKMDIEETTRITKIKHLESSLASILDSGLLPTDLKLIGVEKGCLILKYLIPEVISDVIFTSDIKLTEEQYEDFRSLSVLWLKCGNIKVNIDSGISKCLKISKHGK